MTIDEARKMIEEARSGDRDMSQVVDSILDFDGGLRKADREALARELEIPTQFLRKASDRRREFQAALGVETASQKTERVSAAAARRGLQKNKYAGRCKITGEKVAAGKGFARKADDGKGWDVFSFDAVAEGKDKDNPLAAFSDDELLAEIRRRGMMQSMMR